MLRDDTRRCRIESVGLLGLQISGEDRYGVRLHAPIFTDPTIARMRRRVVFAGEATR
jgi:hypothetical protein